MNITQPLVCPKCGSKHFEAKREATYLYSYKINTPDAKSLSNESDNLPFLFDNREQTDTKEYVECKRCSAKYPCSFGMDGKGIDFTILQKAIRSDHTAKPEFWG